MMTEVAAKDQVNVSVANALCFHCGLPVADINPKEIAIIDDKVFCCEGCKIVYEILAQNDLCQFYEINEKAGFSLRGRKLEQYAWLDDPEVVDRLLDFSDGKTSKITLYLPQIHCASCIWLIENLYKLSKGVLSSKVNFLKKEVYITFTQEQTSLRSIVEILASIGYAPELNFGTLESEKARPVSKRLIFQLGVAGFAFGNIMLLSFPEYFGLGASETWFRNLFGYLNILLAIPVVFYSGKDYLQSAWHALRTWNPGIDIPLSLGIIVLFSRSVYDIVSGTGAGYLDSLAGLVFFLLIGKWFQQMTYHQISFDRDYRSYFPVAANRLTVSETGGASLEESVTLPKLNVGDTILVRHKELIPADGILKKGPAQIDYSFVTGEADPVSPETGDKIYAGGRQVGQAIEVLLTKKVSQSYLTQLWNDEAFGKDKLSGNSKLADKISRYFTLTVLAISLLTFLYWWPIDIKIAINAFTSVLIIACPCAAALNIPFTLGNAVRILARKGFYLKNTNVIEMLQQVTTVVFDKTGTLTHASGNDVLYQGITLTEQEQDGIQRLAMQSSHPLSRRISAFYGERNATVELSGFREFAGMGVEGMIDGKVFRLGSRSFVLDQPGESGNEKETSANVYVGMDGELKGSYQMQSKYRDQTWEMLEWTEERMEAYLLSGDNEREKEFLQQKFTKGRNRLHFNQSPKDKLEFVKQLQQSGKKVMMFGDGLNDAGALQQSDAGIVVTEDANNFTPACDAILDARQFGHIPVYLEYARDSIRVVYAAWLLAAIYNVVGMSFAVQGLLSPVIAAILMPLSSLTIVVFGVGLSTWIARVKLPE